MKKKIAYALVILALLAGVAIGHVTSQAVAGSLCGVNWPGGRADIQIENESLLTVMVYKPFKVLNVKNAGGQLVRINISK
jgi:hypothetical protein